MKKNRNIITDQSGKPSNALGVVSHIYITVMFTIFPLYVGTGGYMNITVNKYSFFVVATMVYFSLLLLVGIGLFAMGKVKLREFNNYIVMTPVRWGILAYIALCVLSALFSKFGIAVWQGLGRFEGLSTILLYGGIFFAVSFFGRFSTLYIYLIGIVVIINTAISVLQFAGYNPLYLFPEGYTYHDAFVLYANQFLVDTISLLKECNSGCKMATNSIEQVLPYIENDKLKSMIVSYNDKHIKIGDKCHQMLNKSQEEEQDPHTMAKVFSWISTEMKLVLNNDTPKIADLLIDGCNMGIKSVNSYINKYNSASEESKNLAKRLVEMEQKFMNELLEYL